MWVRFPPVAFSPGFMPGDFYLIIPLEMEIFMLKQQQGYVLSKIGPHTYLLPYGQSIADQKHGIIINETGEFLWKMLETPQSMDTLITALAGHYHMDITALQLLYPPSLYIFCFPDISPKQIYCRNYCIDQQ